MNKSDRDEPEKEARLREGLRRLAQVWTSGHRDLWPTIQRRLSETYIPERRPQGLRALLNRRPALPGMALLALLLIGIAIGAGWTAIRDLWGIVSLSRSVRQDGWAQPLSLQEAKGPITVRLEWAYADANLILIGYRIQGRASDEGKPYRILLQDPEGRTFPHITSEGVVGASRVLGLPLRAGEAVFVSAFDPWALPDWPAADPNTRSLRLTLEVLPIDSGPPASPSLSEPNPAARAVATAVRPPIGTSPLSFVFTFSIRVLPMQAWGSAQTIRAEGISLTLARWVRTTSGARARLCFSPDDPRRQWLPIAEWVISDTVIRGEAAPVQESPSGAVCRDMYFLKPHPDNISTDSTALRILELIGWDLEDPQAPPLRRSGPWVFRVP